MDDVSEVQTVKQTVQLYGKGAADDTYLRTCPDE
jgi:hypothetical protein